MINENGEKQVGRKYPIIQPVSMDEEIRDLLLKNRHITKVATAELIRSLIRQDVIQRPGNYGVQLQG